LEDRPQQGMLKKEHKCKHSISGASLLSLLPCDCPIYFNREYHFV